MSTYFWPSSIRRIGYFKGWHGGTACSIAAPQLPGLILSSGWIGDSKLVLGVNMCVNMVPSDGLLTHPGLIPASHPSVSPDSLRIHPGPSQDKVATQNE